MKALYPGTFDPITLGHLDIIQRASLLFSEVIIAVAASARKSPLLQITDRLQICQQALAELKNVSVITLTGLSVDCAREQGAQVLIRGVRTGTDFDYELQLAGMNKALAANIETVFLPSSAEVSAISGTMVREIIALDGDVSAFVPSAVLTHLKKIP